MKNKRKMCLFLCVFMSFLIFSGCAKLETIPDLVNVDEKSAKELIIVKGLIPSIKYIYSTSEIEKGNVIKSEPAADTKVDKDTNVTLYISKGPFYIEPRSSTIEYYDENDCGHLIILIQKREYYI